MNRDTQGRFASELPDGLTQALFAPKPDPVAEGFTAAHKALGQARAKAAQAKVDRREAPWSLNYRPPRIREKRATPNIRRAPEIPEPEQMGRAPYHPPHDIS
jgi:hypothetical protein